MSERVNRGGRRGDTRREAASYGGNESDNGLPYHALNGLRWLQAEIGSDLAPSPAARFRFPLSGAFAFFVASFCPPGSIVRPISRCTRVRKRERASSDVFNRAQKAPPPNRRFGVCARPTRLFYFSFNFADLETTNNLGGGLCAVSNFEHIDLPGAMFS